MGRKRDRDEQESAERDEGEDGEDLRRKAEWFRQGRTESTDLSLGTLREAALVQAKQLGTRDLGEFNALVGKPLGKAGFELAGPNDTMPARAKRVDNPSPERALGFAGNAIKVEGADADIAGLRLRIAIDKKTVHRLVPESIRVARWEPDSLQWVLVPRSGVESDGGAAWVSLHRSGTYAPIGLPCDEAAIHSLMLLHAARPLLRTSREPGDLRLILDALFGRAGYAAVADRFTDPDLFPPFYRDARGGQEMMGQQFDGGPIELPGLLHLPGLPDLGRLPEFDLIDDLCPPWLGRKFPWPDGLPWKPWWPTWPRSPWPFIFDWASVGPLNISGRIKSIAINPLNRNMLYAGSADGGVWKTTNAGTYWSPMMSTELSMAIGAIAIAPSNGNIVYAATGEDTPGWSPSYPGVGVYRTSDGGGTWTLLGNGTVGDRCTRVLVDPHNPDRVFVASNNGLWSSSDGGLNWTRSLVGHICDALLDPIDTNRLWAAIWLDGIWQSVDGGASWTRSGSGRLIFTRGGAFVIGRLPTGSAVEWIKLAQGLNGASGRKVLVAKMGPDSGDVYRSNDRGTSWFRVATGVAGASYNEWTNMIAVDPDDDDIVLAGGVGLARATDGSTFANIGGTHSDHHQLVFDSFDPSTCWMATDGGVYRSTDTGANWTLRSDRLAATQLYSLGVSQVGTYLLGGSTQDQGIVASDGISNWRDTHAGNEGGFFVVDPNNSNNVYACPWDNNLVRSTDRAFTWTSIRNGITETVGTVVHGPAEIAHIAVQPGHSSTLIAAGSLDLGPRLYRSADQGGTWTKVLTPAAAVTYIAFAPSDGSRVYAVTAGGRLHRSSSGGTSGSWAEPSVTAPTGNRINVVAVAPSNRDVVWIGCGGYSGERARWSDDGGATWHDGSGVLPGDQLPALPINAVAIDQNNSDVVYVGNDIEVFRTRDRGQSWEDFSNGFLLEDVPRIIITGLEIRRSTNTLYASSMGRGAYRRNLG